MNQRLYFLLPDRDHTLRVVNELLEQRLELKDMHTLTGRGLVGEGLPASDSHQRNNFAGRVEYWVWRANLALFFLAAVALAAMVFLHTGLWVLLPLAVMVATFLLGERFARLPNVHLQEFRDALRHGEILLMVDVPRERVNEVEYRVKAHHPGAVAGGSSWNAPALGT
jgi:Flp pilus assembly protein TadB